VVGQHEADKRPLQRSYESAAHAGPRNIPPDLRRSEYAWSEGDCNPGHNSEVTVAHNPVERTGRLIPFGPPHTGPKFRTFAPANPASWPTVDCGKTTPLRSREFPNERLLRSNPETTKRGYFPIDHNLPGTLILEHRAHLASACDLMIRSDAKGPHTQTNPSSTDRKRVRARIDPDRSPAAPALR